MTYRIVQGDCIEVMRQAKAESCDSVVCDPPYGIEFMGKTWDSPQRMVGEATGVSGGFQGIPVGVPRPDLSRTDPHLFQQWCQAWAIEALRVLKPGGHLVAFGSPRMYHRLAAGIEDAGFEIRDQLIWMYGQGMPKGCNIANAVDGKDGRMKGAGTGAWKGKLAEGAESGHYSTRFSSAGVKAERSDEWSDEARKVLGWNTQLKPAMEPILVARKPCRIPGKRPGATKKASVVANMVEHGVGAYNIDACRIQMSDADRAEAEAKNRHADFGSGPRNNSVYGVDKRPVSEGGNWSGEKGRYPANVLLDEAAAAMLNAQTGELKGGGFPARQSTDGGGVDRSAYGEFGGQDGLELRRMYSGGASRFFKVIESEDCSCDRANTVENSSGQPSPSDGSALEVVSHEPRNVHPGSPEPSTSETRSASRPSDASGTPPIQNTDGACSPALPPTSITEIQSPARSAGQSAPTDITTTTTYPSTSDGSAENVTSQSTLSSTDHGAPACRFRYCAKASKAERVAGPDGKKHPTVKPEDVMAWLITLVTPPGGQVLDPFMGSGSTGVAAVRRGFRFIGIEMVPEYVAIAQQRIGAALETKATV